MRKKIRVGIFFNVKALILAFGSTFLFSFFIGTFWNPQITTQVYDLDHRFYINRGYPVAWAGISDASKNVELPFVKMPFLKRNLSIDDSEWVKIIDLGVFIQLFTTFFIVAYLIAFPLAKAGEENGIFNLLLVISYIILFPLCFFVYFFLFPRI